MNNLEIAIAWQRAGCKVFPCYEADEWVGPKLHSRKSPRTAKGFFDATNDLSVITKYWESNPSHLVGVVAGTLCVLDIDLNAENGKDGWFEIEDAGLEIPATISTKTPSGGHHYFYKQPAGMSLGPIAGVKLPGGIRLSAVDRRAGNSYFIAWSSTAPDDIQGLPEAPLWLCEAAPVSITASFSGSVSEWESNLKKGPASKKVHNAMTKFPEGDFGHSEMITRQAELVHLGSDGESGIPEALSQLRDLWLREPFNTVRYVSDWDSALAGAVKGFGGSKDASVASVDDFDAEVAKVARELKIKNEAIRLVASEGYNGSEVIPFDDLFVDGGRYLVQDLVPAEGISFLVARPNIGKTFAYIDMVCRMTFGMPWLNKATTRAKTLIVLGEGRGGFGQRLKDWCEHHEKDLMELDEWVTFVDGANLNSPVSIERLRSVVIEKAIEFVILDTWSNVSGVANEDDAALNAITLNAVREFCPDGSILFVHHPRKANEEKKNPVMRGSTVLQGRADVVMSLTYDADHATATGRKREWIRLSTESVHAGKNRNARTETIHGLYLHKQDDRVVLCFDDSATVSKRASSAVHGLVGEMTAKEFAKVNGIAESTARRILMAGVESGLIERIRPLRKNQPDRYRLKNAEPNWRELIERAS